MKKLTLILLLVLFSCSGCSTLSKHELDSEKIKPIEITEKYFISQIKDVFYNFEDYEGKTLKVEGLYTVENLLDGEPYYLVFRYGPDCCGDDEWGGFFLNYDGEWPEVEDWIEVEGTPRIEQIGQTNFLFLDVTKLTVKEERGLIFVEQ